MKAQLDAMRYDQRPWVSLSLEAVGPLQRTPSGWTFSVKSKLSNVGRSPAIDVDFVPLMTFLGPPKASNAGTAWMFPDPSKDVKATIEAACSFMHMPGLPSPSGQIMFPGEDKTQPFLVHTAANPPDQGYVASFIVVGCVTYRIQGDAAWHRTVAGLDVGKRSYQLIDLRGETLQGEDLSYGQLPGGSYAD